MARPDLHAEITAGILEQLRQGIRPWARPWEDGEKGAPAGVDLPLRDTGEPYNGVNVLVLWSAALAKGYTAPTWMTFNQAKRHGGAVRKGEKSQTVVYAKTWPKRKADPATGKEEVEMRGFLKSYRVFNVEQIDGLGERWHRSFAEIHPINPERRSERLDGFFSALGVDIRHGGAEAYYVLADDYIQMPPFELFHDSQAYYTTLAHESVHWTRHASRLNRTFRGSYQVPYAKEELVAEIGSAFLSAELGIAPAVREDHADYIGAWLRVLEDDSKAIFRAAGHASKAVSWLHARAPGYRIAQGGRSMTTDSVGTVAVEEERSRTLGMPAGAVQGTLFRSTTPVASLHGARDARAFVAAAVDFLGREERSEKGNLAAEARSLRSAADRLDLKDSAVTRAIEAAVIRSRYSAGSAEAGRLPRTAEDFVALVKDDVASCLADQRMARARQISRGSISH